MDNILKNNFVELEKRKLKKFGNPPLDVQDNIDKNMNIIKTVGATIELFTDRFIKTIIKMNG